MEEYIEKCECFIHSLQKDGVPTLAMATIERQTGVNKYVADYNGIKCSAIFNPFVGRYFVDDKYGVIHEKKAPVPSR